MSWRWRWCSSQSPWAAWAPLATGPWYAPDFPSCFLTDLFMQNILTICCRVLSEPRQM